ncbi:MAG: hypothetical protein A2036_00315 [Omnitrophica bacterium GWA2_50_21]|nr:MAG: hypothetical protein A2036_00315 [Omnitrophica bacterium GWA2_50_21]
MHEALSRPWVWVAVALAGFFLCTALPIWIKNDRLRKIANWFVLIPVSLVIIGYVYPMGIELFKKLAVNWQ